MLPSSPCCSNTCTAVNNVWCDVSSVPSHQATAGHAVALHFDHVGGLIGQKNMLQVISDMPTWLAEIAITCIGVAGDCSNVDCCYTCQDTDPLCNSKPLRLSAAVDDVLHCSAPAISRKPLRMSRHGCSRRGGSHVPAVPRMS
jgi:hypothetical protein